MSSKKYTRQGDFTDDETNNIAGRAEQKSATLDAEFDELVLVTDEHADDLDILLRDDGKVKDDLLVGHEFSQNCLSYLKGQIGNENSALVWRGNWVTGTGYEIGDLVLDNGVSNNVYIALTDYTSGANVSADVSAGDLQLFVEGGTASLPGGTAAYEVLARNAGDTASEWVMIDANHLPWAALIANTNLTGVATVQGMTFASGHTAKIEGRLVATPHDYGTLATGATGFAIDFSKSPVQLVDNGGNAGTITVTSANLANGAMVEVFIEASTVADRAINFPAGWRFIGYKPPELLANKDGVLTLRCVGGTADANVFASWVEEL